MFSQAITYNGLTINSGAGLNLGTGSVGGLAAGYLINSMQFSDITTQEYLQKRALQDGFFATDVYLGGRTVTIDASIYGTSRAQTYDLLQAWTGAFSPRIAYNADTANVGFLPFTFYQPTDNIAVWDRLTYPKGIPMQVYLRPMKPVHYDLVNNGEGSDPKRGWSIRTLTTLFARDPRRYLQTPQVVTGLVSATTGNVASVLTYRGDYPTWGVWSGTITSALGSNWSAFTIGSKPVGLSYTGGVVINLSTYTGSLSYDFSTRLLSDNTGAGQNSLIVSSAAVAEIGPGPANFFNVSGMAGSIGSPVPITAFTSSTFTYREAFT